MAEPLHNSESVALSRAQQDAPVVTVEYAVRYTAPDTYAGIVAHLRTHRDSAEAMARHENSTPGFACTVVHRTVSYGPWTATTATPAPPRA